MPIELTLKGVRTIQGAFPCTGKALVLLVAMVFGAPAVQARTEIAAICDDAARVVSAESGVPLDVLRSISLTETGRNKNGDFLPWPWTVNMEGIGKWFDTYEEAQAYVDSRFARGARSFDVGCFQINYRWHGEAFSSVAQMFEPLANARYAARFLSELHAEFGDWSRAAGAYHSRSSALARKYSARFDRIRARLPHPAVLPAAVDDVVLAAATPADLPATSPRVNRYPFLVPGGTPFGLASLVPQAESVAQRFLPLDQARPMAVLR